MVATANGKELRDMVSFHLYNPSMAVAFPPLLFNLFIAVLLMESACPAFAQQLGVTATPSGPIGASMAVLATLQDADVLPPENSPDANRVIKLVIQFQSVFMKSDDSAVQKLFTESLAAQSEGDGFARDALVRFRLSGWTSEVLEALNHRWNSMTVDQRRLLSPGFRRFNVSVDDFEWLMELVAKARRVFLQRGQTLHQVFAQRRRDMPGGASSPQQGGRNGHESLHFDQS